MGLKYTWDTGVDKFTAVKTPVYKSLTKFCKTRSHLVGQASCSTNPNLVDQILPAILLKICLQTAIGAMPTNSRNTLWHASTVVFVFEIIAPS